ncbi:hypothetical protein [Natrinema versiforme]|uniref:Uncharacterized protein n=1 Tax=Natrinema versiforme TaxID=88724 RepID=A0A4P8WKM6_9EURY|nr:hypothetical protein [Natrinema versiforme]QCS44098.1 hypothetical protein FEJ81_17770 [Natrinema versiforme]
MSADADRDDRDLEADPGTSTSGRVRVPVDAVCVGCGRIRVTRTSLEAMEIDPRAALSDIDAADCTSFKHVCRSCRAITWWNPIAILTGLLESERERGE